MNKRLKQDILFCLQLGFHVIGSFVFAAIIGFYLDRYFQSKPVCLLILLFLAFGHIIRMLLGVGKNG